MAFHLFVSEKKDNRKQTTEYSGLMAEPEVSSLRLEADRSKEGEYLCFISKVVRTHPGGGPPKPGGGGKGMPGGAPGKPGGLNPGGGPGIPGGAKGIGGRCKEGGPTRTAKSGEFTHNTRYHKSETYSEASYPCHGLQAYPDQGPVGACNVQISQN